MSREGYKELSLDLRCALWFGVGGEVVTLMCTDVFDEVCLCPITNSLSLSLAGSGCSSRKWCPSPAQPLSLWPIDFLPLRAAQMMASERSCLRTETFLLLSYSATSAPLPPLLTGTPKCPYVTKDWQAWPRKGIWLRTGALLEKVVMSKTKLKK